MRVLIPNKITRRFDKLEKQIDSLINNIHSQRQSETPLSVSTPPHGIPGSTLTAKEKHEGAHPVEYQKADNSIPPVSLPVEYILPGHNVWPENEAAEALCFIFRSELSIFFPFVTPPNEPASVLRHNHPCLFKAMVVASSYQNRALQIRRGAALTEELAKRLLIDGEKTRDILQALLISIAW